MTSIFICLDVINFFYRNKMTINIISGDVRGINDVHNTLTVSKYSGDSDNTK